MNNRVFFSAGSSLRIWSCALLLIMICDASGLLVQHEGRVALDHESEGKHAHGIHPKFGRHMLKHFTLQPGYTNLNHGSYGSTPKYVQNAQSKYRAEMESVPDVWFRKSQYSEMDQVRTLVARYIKAEPEDVVFVENASHGVNSVLRSLLRGGGKILYMNLAYQMVKNTIEYVRETFNESVVEVVVELPITADGIVEKTAAALDANPGLTFAVIDHISSCPAVVLPLDRLIPLLKARGLMVLIDGAHAIGHIPLDVPSLGADFYVSNGHKWLYSPKASAILWARRDVQSLLHPTVISGLGKGMSPFQLQFSYQGTGDVTAFVAMRDALAFRESIGGEDHIMTYIRKLAAQGAALLVEMWGTETLVGDDMACAMVNVKLPYCTNETAVSTLPNTLLDRYNTWVPSYKLSDVWWVRVSAQIYNDIEDFRLLGNAVLEILGASASTEL